MQLSPRDWSRFLTVREITHSVVGTGWEELVPEDLDRVALVIGLSAQNATVLLSTVGPVDEFGTPSGGIALTSAVAGGTPNMLMLDHERFGSMPQKQWLVAGQGSVVTALEMVMERFPAGKYQRGLPSRWSTSYEPPES